MVTLTLIKISSKILLNSESVDTYHLYWDCLSLYATLISQSGVKLHNNQLYLCFYISLVSLWLSW